jgi:hypothetical protein
MFPHFCSFWGNQPLDSGLEFTYSPLAGTSALRLLRLHPSFWTETPIRCDMVTSSLEKFRFPYTAISYNWDPPETPKWAIQVDRHRCKVYTNVVSILKSMRSTYRFQYVWIDSVCIDQSNNAEKSAQVRIMRQIYENASYVVGWLGGADYSGSNYLATMVKMFIRFLKGDTTEHRAINMIFRINSSRYLQDISPQASPQEFYQQHPPALWDALGSLTRNRWLERVWKYKKLQCRRK